MKRARGPALVLCGLGEAPPETTTLQARLALRACDAVYRRVPPAAEVLAQLRRGRTVGLALPGGPASFPAGVWALARRAKGAGASLVVPPAVGPLVRALSAKGRVFAYDELWARCLFP